MAYPQDAQDEYRAKQNLPGLEYDAAKQTTIFVEDFQALESSMQTVQSVLGVEPNGTSSTVSDRIGAVEAILGGPTTETLSSGDMGSDEGVCPIRVTAPVGAIADAYRGTVSGSIVGYAYLPPDTYTVQSYKYTDTDYIQPSSATVDGEGNFTLDLSTTPPERLGVWHFALLNSSSAQTGQKWPQYRSSVQITSISPSYRNLVLEINGAMSDAAAANIGVQISTNNGASWMTADYYTAVGNGAVFVSDILAGGPGDIDETLAYTGVIHIYGYTGGAMPHSAGFVAASDGSQWGTTNGIYSGGVDAIDGIRILWTGGAKFTAGNFQLIGVK